MNLKIILLKEKTGTERLNLAAKIKQDYEHILLDKLCAAEIFYCQSLATNDHLILGYRKR